MLASELISILQVYINKYGDGEFMTELGSDTYDTRKIDNAVTMGYIGTQKYYSITPIENE